MKDELKAFLDEKADQYNNKNFILEDPIQIPHHFSSKEDIEISGFLISIIAWGNRKAIIKSGQKLLDIMQHSPFEYIMNVSEDELNELEFVHRTFSVDDLRTFIRSLKNLYQIHDGLEGAFSHGDNVHDRIERFRELFFEVPHEARTTKHISSPAKGSAAKRINMFLRWMVRDDKRGVDFGIWKNIPASELCIPLDVHTGNVARELGLLKRKSNDWKAVEELMSTLRTYDPNDPSKYDFALFGIGINNDLTN